MPESNTKIEELEALLSRQMDGSVVSDAELQRLRELLHGDAEARRVYIRHCQMHAMLKEEQEMLASLSDEQAPGNIVPLPRSGPPGEPAAKAGAPSTEPAVNHAPYAIAACLLGALILGGMAFLEREGGRNASHEAALEKTGGANPVEASPQRDNPPTPEEEYREKLLAMADGGSQNRPPTPFSSDGGGALPAPGKVDFNRDIRPVLSDNCFHCHGPSEADRKADLRLDTADGILADLGGYAAVAPGDPGASELVARILHDDPDEIMPPPKTHKKLSEAQKDLLERWVSEGAEWREHWAFEPVTQPKLPEVRDASWSRNAIDRFILKRLDETGLKPAPEASRHALIRRATLDLTGLPPAPAEINAFVADESETAYENLIDRLLASPRYGEHRARYWLDAARYGDTHGLHLDNYREIWAYRDWVINAYNDNVPFDRFTVEQLAGDLLAEPTLEQRVATGFNRCNVTTSEGGAIDEEFAARYAVDRVATTSTVWMGLTTGCAVCHDHKYDPISTKEFYQLYAYFNNTTQPAMDGNIEDSPPVIRLFETPEDEAIKEKLEGRIAKLDGQLEERSKEAEPAFEAWLRGFTKESAKAENALDVEGRILDFEAGKGVAKEGSGDGIPAVAAAGADARLSAGEAFTIRMKVKYPESKAGQWTLFSRTDAANGDRGYRIVLDGSSFSVELIEKWPDRALQIASGRAFSPGAEKEIFVTYDGSGRADGISIYDGSNLLGNRYTVIRKNAIDDDFVSDAPFEVAVVNTYAAEPEMGVREIQIYSRQLTGQEIEAVSKAPSVPGLLAKALDHLAKEEKKEGKEKANPVPGREALLAHYLLKESRPYRELMLRRAGAETALNQVLSRTPTTLVMQDKANVPAMARILERGEYDKPGEEVFPGVPGVLPDLPEDAPPNRLGLARWLVDPAHPLTARVTVNRMWQELFGTGIVKTSEDFGTQGEPPSHPELLDWLAAEFVESGWDVKGLYRKMMLSATYRQSSAATPPLRKLDPENRLLARGPRFRLDAEMIRDQALYVSGLLVEHIGGPSVRPYQPAGLWKTVGYSGSNTVEFHQDHGEALHRRSLYTFWKRTSHPPNMAAFDAPNRESCTVRRERTNTPLQALVLMNDPHFVEASRALAQRILEERDERNVRDSIDWMAALVLGRPLEGEEREILSESLDDFENAYLADPESARELAGGEEAGGDPVALAAWTMLANQMLNLDEVITKN